MELTGMVFVTHDVDADAASDWCRWYDTDHLPEYVALPGVMAGRRYVATPELHALRAPNADEPFADGRSSFLTTYLLCGDDLQATWATMADATRSWNEAGRRFDPSRVHARHIELLQLDWAIGAPGLETSVAALPFMGHLGVQAALGEVADPTKRDEISRWYREVHAPDVVSVPGVAAALRFRSLLPDGRHFVLFLLHDEPARVVSAVRAQGATWRAAGRTPSPGGASRSLFNGPFRNLQPLGIDDQHR